MKHRLSILVEAILVGSKDPRVQAIDHLLADTLYIIPQHITDGITRSA